jgi:hypothetical protein
MEVTDPMLIDINEPSFDWTTADDLVVYEAAQAGDPRAAAEMKRRGPHA